jgi:hypothetical protein
MQDLTPNTEATPPRSESNRQPMPGNDRIFISYARENETFALRLAGALKSRGIPVWLDQWDIPPGADWDQTIDRALRGSSKVIAVLSPEAVASRHVRAEIQVAVDAKDKTLFPVLHKDCLVPRILQLYQFSDFRKVQDFERELARLLEAFKANLKPAEPP